MKRIFLAAIAAFGALFFLAPAAEARVQIHIDLSAQRMSVASSSGSYVWPVSTARSGYYTPHGAYAPTSLQRMHYSHKYHMSPMPYSIFFRGGYAIHGTYAVSSLGRPASHGCVRLSPSNAAALFEMVHRDGASISISGTPPGGHLYAQAHRTHHRTYVAHRTHAHRYYASAGRHRAPMAYAPVHHGYGVHYWQQHPTRW